MRRILWVMLLVLGIALLMWWGFFQQIIRGQPWGSNPGPDWIIWLTWLIFGILFPIGFYKMRLDVQVFEDHISIRYFPLTTRLIDVEDIVEVESITYNPIREFGGWGIRGWSDHRAYTISGNRGVRLLLNNRDHLLIGSQNPEKLALAVLTILPDT